MPRIEIDDRARLRKRVDRWAQRLKVAPRTVRIQRMVRKWGSCSSGGVVTLADDLADRSTDFQDFVIVHELLHLRVPNHGRLFKALMSAYVRGWREQNVLRGR
jgi:predicted metal-dependent hydrolase